MANLFTSHDPYNLHKVLGFACLLNFILRSYYIITFGTAFPTHEPIFQAVTLVTLHGVLSLSSLALPLPSKRNFTSPMIWPEFRLHSIIFGLRQVIATLFSILEWWPSNKLNEACMKLGLIMLTIKCASWVTENFGDRERRTTNSMPYPIWISEDLKEGIKTKYALAQFGATRLIILGDPSMIFFTLLGIQMAPLLMTLVRKGKITSVSYHRFYATALMIGYFVYAARICILSDRFLTHSSLFASTFPLLSLRKAGMSKYGIWIVFAILHYGLTPILVEDLGIPFIMVLNAMIYLPTYLYNLDRSLFSGFTMVLLSLVCISIKPLFVGMAFPISMELVEQKLMIILPIVFIPLLSNQIKAFGCLFINHEKSYEQKN